VKNIVVFGAGGMGREVLWIIDSINEQCRTWNVLGFLDDKHTEFRGKDIHGFTVVGGLDWLSDHNGEIYLTCAVGKSSVRKTVYESAARLPNVRLAILVDPTVRVDRTVNIGEGSIISRNCIVTVNIEIGKGVLMNTGSSVGHDAVVGDHCTFLTNAMASGNTTFGECCEIGSGAFVLQGKSIAANTVVAPLSSVIMDITESGTYAGNPARRIR